MAGRVERTTVRSLLFDLAVCASVLILSLPYGHRGHLLFGILMAVALGWRRRWPLAVMLVVSGLALGHLVVLGKPDPTSFDVAVLIAMYSVVKYAPRLWHAGVAAGITATGLAIEQARHWNRGWLTSSLMLAGLSTAVWLIGYTLRTRRAVRARVSRSGRPPPNGSATTWRSWRSPTSGRRSPGNCTMWSRTASPS